MKNYFKFFLALSAFIIPSLLSAQINPANITIARDSFGVPHIYAPTDAEVAYGLAWAHSEDDFPSILQSVLIGKHRLGELTGVAGAKIDFFAQYIKASERVEGHYNELPTSYKKLLDGYAAGLNAYVKAHPEEVKMKNIFPITGMDLEKAYATVTCALTGAADAMGAVMNGKNFESAISVGSNGIAISSKFSADGSTYLVNDPHWLIDGGITFYECHLVSDEGWNINGGVYPGIPMPANGVTPNLGWNLPFNFPDLIDIYELEINPENKKQYKFDGKWLDLEVRKIPLTVKIGGLKLHVKKEAYWTVYGPALKAKGGKIMATRFAANQKIGALNQLYEMSKAKNLAEFKQAVKAGNMPLFNIIYADKEDNIFYIYKALIPNRNPKYNWQKVLPGNTSETLWTDFLPADALPQVTNPDCGYIYDMNTSPYQSTCAANDPKRGIYDTTAGFYIDPENDRSIRFRELVDGKSKLTYRELKNIKYDLDYPKKSQGAFEKTLRAMQMLDEKHPEIADAIQHLKSCKLDGRLDNRHTALYLITIGQLFKGYDINKRKFLNEGFSFDDKLFTSSVTYAKKYLLKYHHTFDLPLNDVQKLIRGDKMLAIPGLPQNLNSTEGELTKNGYIKINRCSSFLQFARYTKNGVELESIHTYGSSNRPGTKHYDDQMEMHTKFQTKKETFDKNEILKKAEKVYHPG